ncbi:hypothetical protein EFL95_12160 [Nocardioides marmorisolisilvae]|uniref:DUF2567 domain-containing protein n=2 Tax=Nocardioides marmorisolisilvae TaxID=1542737 RepID=A0A3N0DVS0_9ACTN|nr:hypothetical protein EFL95_12160 [Nocardioides marmorisolisilvae]
MPPAFPGGEAGDEDRNAAVRDGLTTLSVVVAWFAVAAFLGALVWWQVTPLAEYTRTRDNASMDEEQLAKQFGADGWFFVIAAVGGLVSGLVLGLLRRRNPILLVLLLGAGGALATFLMVQFGLMLGPNDPSTMFASTPVGGKVPLQLKVDAHGIWFLWPITALVGGIIALWITEARETSRLQHAAAYGYPGPAHAVQNQR